MVIISACLLGENCKYNGGNNECKWVQEHARQHRHVSVCPERNVLPTPRPPAEIRNGRVYDREGNDVTEAFIKGAQDALTEAENVALREGLSISGAILKAGSPSCGCGTIYDGTFTGTPVSGNGFFARLLLERGIHVTTEKEKME